MLSSHLLNSRHPVRKSKFATCAVTGYCSLNKTRVAQQYRGAYFELSLVFLLIAERKKKFGDRSDHIKTTLQRSWQPAQIGLSAIVVAAIATIVENSFHMIATIAVFFFQRSYGNRALGYLAKIKMTTEPASTEDPSHAT